MKNSIPYLLAIVIMASLCLTMGCQGKAVYAEPEYQRQQAGFINENIHSGITTPQLKRLVDGNSRFAIDLYRQLLTDEDLLAQKDGNIICSPLSASIALAMAYAGSEGKTRREMEDVLNFDLGGETTHAGFNSLSNVLNGAGDAGSFQLHSANSLWLQYGLELGDDFSRITDTYYSGSLEFVDFQGEPQKTCDTINEWVEGKTNDRIKDLMVPEMITPMTVLAIVNAVFFKAGWMSPFDEDETDYKLFTVLDDEHPYRDVSMMEQEGELPYMEGENFQALRLEYEGSLASMIIILPELEDFLEFEQSMDMALLNEIMTSFETQHLKVYLPSFEFEIELPLSQTLKDMGMPSAFMGGFESIFKTGFGGPVFIETVKQKAFIALDEEGTEAAAATVVTLGLGGGPPPEVDPPLVFKADHPFIFMIVEHSTNTILFMGRITDPSRLY